MANDTWPVHNVASAVVESMKRHQRKESDFYPTPAEGTQAILDELDLPKSAKIWDPACGEGDLDMVCRANGYQTFASDLNRTGYGKPGIDFLRVALGPTSQRPTVIMTNPPFALAEKFIRKAVTLAPVVVMLLKSNYWHTNNRLKLWDDCPPTAQHPVSWRLAFLKEERGNSPLMDCTWFVWDASKPPLPDRPLPKPPSANVPDVSLKPLPVYLARLERQIDRLNDALCG